MKNILLFFICCLALGSCAPSGIEQLQKKTATDILLPEQILTLVENNTLYLQVITGDSYLYFDETSILYGKDINGNRDTGRWDVSESGELCLRMNKWWFGDLRCFQVLRSAETYHLANSSGVLEYRAQQIPGDQENLFYNLKSKQKKSFRKAFQEKSAPEQTVTTAASRPDIPAASPSIIDSMATMDTVAAKEDLRSTVKWMAKDCPGCNLANANLNKADLIEANLAGADLRRADLSQANLRRANLQNANLAHANLAYANLPGANLQDTNLSGASLKGANLIRANLSGADLSDADLSDALLEGAIGLQ